MFKKFLCTILIATVSATALAAVRTVSWTKATTNVDGSSIPSTGAGSITTAVEYGTCNGENFGTKIADVVANSTGTSVPTPNLTPGTYCFRAKHVNTYGVESDAVVVKYVEAAPKPNPPTGFTIGQ